MLLPYSTIKNSFSSLTPDNSWSFKETKRTETNYISHGYHRYPAKFIPQIVNRLIMEFTDNDDLVFDPFGGCGTTLVEAKVLGRRSVGFDINPVAKLITETKITPIYPNKLENYLRHFEKNYEIIKNRDIFLNHSEQTRYWFDSIIQEELDKLFTAINEIGDYQVRRFYLCAFSHILKNCSKWLMKSIKPQIDPTKISPDVITTFIGHIKHMMLKNSEFYTILKKSDNLKTSSKMRLRDSTKKFPLETSSIDLIITSPPYVTSYEYADLHQLILLWLGDDPNRYSRWHKYVQQYQSFRKKFVGTKLAEHKGEQFLGFLAHNIVSQLPDNRKCSRSIAKYFSDMQKAVAEMYRVLKPGKKACIIIGNTTLAGVEIKNAEVAAEQMQEAGFVVNKVIKRKLSNKMITPWRDKINGRFTSTTSPQKTRVYEYEFILVAEKSLVSRNNN